MSDLLVSPKKHTAVGGEHINDMDLRTSEVHSPESASNAWIELQIWDCVTRIVNNFIILSTVNPRVYTLGSAVWINISFANNWLTKRISHSDQCH